MQTRISGTTKEVVISDKEPTVLVGERIDANREKVNAALMRGDLEPIRKEAFAQVQAGADVLDVNVGIAGIDESVLLRQVVQMVTSTVDVPLCLDSPNPKALEEALKVCRGKPLVNAVTGQEHSLEVILPLVKQYKVAVIGLVIDDEGIPEDPEKRVAIACKIVKRAEALGIACEDIVIDCLLQSVGADANAAIVTIETIEKLRAKLPVNVTVGGSNGSYGLPDRNLLNSAFIAMAIAAGATCAIVNVAKIRPIVLAADLLMGRDKYARRYIEAYRQRRQHPDCRGFR